MAHLLDNPPVRLPLLFGGDIRLCEQVLDRGLKWIDLLRGRSFMVLFGVVYGGGGEQARRAGECRCGEEWPRVRAGAPEEELAREHYGEGIVGMKMEGGSLELKNGRTKLERVVLGGFARLIRD